MWWPDPLTISVLALAMHTSPALAQDSDGVFDTCVLRPADTRPAAPPQPPKIIVPEYPTDVTGDFALPYLCCEDCDQEDDAPRIELPRGSFCDDTGSTYPIDLSPSGGEVQGSGDVTGNDPDGYLEPVDKDVEVETEADPHSQPALPH